MFSLQRFLSRDDKFYDLMEGSAQEARGAIQSLVALLRDGDEKPKLEAFAAARRKEKRLAQELSEKLCKTTNTTNGSGQKSFGDLIICISSVWQTFEYIY